MKNLMIAPLVCMMTAGVAIAGQGNGPNGVPFEELDARITELSTRLDAQEQDVSGIASSVDSINQQIVDINARLEEQDMSALVLEIQALREDTATDIQTLFDLVSSMQTQIEGLGGGTNPAPSGDLNAPPPACLTGNDLGTGSGYVVCSADENEAWISASNFEGGQYHAEMICHQLGYREASIYSGTCGSVCGFCEGDTSCENLGLSPQDINPSYTLSVTTENSGNDMLGDLIEGNVQWICVN